MQCKWVNRVDGWVVDSNEGYLHKMPDKSNCTNVAVVARHYLKEVISVENRVREINIKFPL